MINRTHPSISGNMLNKCTIFVYVYVCVCVCVYICVCVCVCVCVCKKKGKVIPLQARCGPEGG